MLTSQQNSYSGLPATTEARTDRSEAATSPRETTNPSGTADPSATTSPDYATAGAAGAVGAAGALGSGKAENHALYGGIRTRRVTVRDLAAAKARGEKWPMLTAYDALTARIFDDAGIPVLLVGDSAAMVVYGHDTTIPVTVDELIPLTSAVVRGTSRALVVADLPFGSYQASPQTAIETAIRFLKETGAHAVKLEGGHRVLRTVEDLVSSGVPVMAHLGLTPQSVHALGGYRVQGRGEDGETLIRDAKSLQTAGAFAVVLECIPTDLAAQVTAALTIPTIGIGAGPDCDAQVLVWQDMAGLSPRTPKFAKRYANLASTLTKAAQEFAQEVTEGTYPTPEYSYR